MLRAGRSEDRIPVGARFSSPVQTGSEAHPASYTMGTASFPGLKRPGRGVDHPPPSSAEVKETVQLYFYSASRPSWPVLRWTLPLPLHSFFLPPSMLSSTFQCVLSRIGSQKMSTTVPRQLLSYMLFSIQVIATNADDSNSWTHVQIIQ